MWLLEQLTGHNSVLTGRASTAIYLILTANGIRDANVLVPANICYAAVYPILYSGNRPLFADVGPDGNLTLESIRYSCDPHRDVAAAIVPHMYGNPCLDLPRIADCLRSRNCIVIEDCASAMGVLVDGRCAGTYSDFVLYSFGHSKTIDVGYGGLVTSRRALDAVRTLNETLPERNGAIEREIRLFSEIYRALRGHAAHPVAKCIFQLLPEGLKTCFLHRLTPSQEMIVWERTADLTNVIQRRIRRAQAYGNGIRFHENMQQYVYHRGAVPWRFNVLVDSRRREMLIRHLLRANVRVSNWYPVVTPMFGIEPDFPNCSLMEAEILNLPLDESVTADEIQRTGESINWFWANIGTCSVEQTIADRS